MTWYPADNYSFTTFCKVRVFFDNLIYFWSSKDLLNLQLKTELYAGLWMEVESFKQYCIESFWRRTYRGGSFASMQRRDDGDICNILKACFI